MSEGSRNAKELSLGNGFGDVVVKAGGIRIEIHSDGTVDAYTNGPVYAHATSNEVPPARSSDESPLLRAKTAPEIGDEMTDGTIYAGISPDTHKPMYARPKDESETYSFDEAAKQGKNIGDGFRVPTIRELGVLWENRNKGKLKGTFNKSGSDSAGWYWSSTPLNFYDTLAQRFSDGNQGLSRYGLSSLRLVR